MFTDKDMLVETYKELFSNSFEPMSELIRKFQDEVDSKIKIVNINSLNFIDTDLLNEIKMYEDDSNVHIQFGSSLSDIKCTIKDDNSRKHVVCVEYKSYQRLLVTSTQLPHSELLEHEFKQLNEIVSALQQLILELEPYFHQLELIDRLCTVKEPRNPSFKDDYRKILVDDRTWLHVEVTTEGIANNLHLIGQSELWQNKLQEGLIKWDHDKDIVQNILEVFDLPAFPQKSQIADNEDDSDSQVCSICLCIELPDIQGVPQPFCNNVSCGAFFHRDCLYMWLVTSAGNRPQTFGVATGICPSCLQAIACNEKES